MIQFIKGKIVNLGIDTITVECQGIGYLIYFKQQNQCLLNQDTIIYTHLALRQDDVSLYGFLTKADLDLYLRLLKVKGIGPKSAQAIFAGSNSDRIIQAIENSDVAYLKTLPGIGNKAASQLVLDLKGKLVVETSYKNLSVNIQEALDGLRNLGYKANELSKIEMQLAQYQDKSVQEIIPIALQLLNKKKWE